MGSDLDTCTYRNILLLHTIVFWDIQLSVDAIWLFLITVSLPRFMTIPGCVVYPNYYLYLFVVVDSGQSGPSSLIPLNARTRF